MPSSFHLEGLALVGRRQVDGQVGHTQDGPLDLEQPLRHAAVGPAHEDAPRDGEVAVKPRVP
jgi:hypothetical protein